MSAPLFIHYGDSKLHYHRFGHGNQWLFCFHGYGEDGSKFLFLNDRLHQSHTIIAIDMPFHGNTNWTGPLLLDPAELMDIIRQMIPPKTPIQLMGYSMGGRICLQLLEIYPQEISRLILIAPDGLHKNLWQKFSTQTWVGNQLFRFTMRYPNWMFGLMDLSNKMGLFNKSISKFAHQYLDDANEREQLYKRWTTMRKFRPRKKRLREIIALHKIKVHMLFGKYDRVIVSKHGFNLQRGLEQFISVEEIEAGHQLLQEKFNPYFLKIIEA